MHLTYKTKRYNVWAYIDSDLITEEQLKNSEIIREYHYGSSGIVLCKLDTELLSLNLDIEYEVKSIEFLKLEIQDIKAINDKELKSYYQSLIYKKFNVESDISFEAHICCETSYYYYLNDFNEQFIENGMGLSCI